MAKITIDLTNYKDRTGSRVPAGRYRVQVEDVEVTTASTGSTMINTWFRISGGEQDGAVVLDRFVISEKALFRVVAFMQAIGLPTPKKRISVDPDKWVGKVLDVDVSDGEPYQGRVRSEVDGYLKPAKTEAAETPEDDLFDGDADDDENVEDVEAVEEVEEAPAEKPKAKAKAQPKAEDVEEDAPEELDLDDIDL